jgi:hypothetical protein
MVLLQAFSIYADVDDGSRADGIYACRSYAPDFTNMPKSSDQPCAANSVNASYEVG